MKIHSSRNAQSLYLPLANRIHSRSRDIRKETIIVRRNTTVKDDEKSAANGAKTPDDDDNDDNGWKVATGWYYTRFLFCNFALSPICRVQAKGARNARIKWRAAWPTRRLSRKTTLGISRGVPWERPRLISRIHVIRRYAEIRNQNASLISSDLALIFAFDEH